MATGDPLKSTKAVVAAALGFVAPGAAYLIGVSFDGVSGTEWLVAGLCCLAGATAGGYGVYRVENKPKV